VIFSNLIANLPTLEQKIKLKYIETTGREWIDSINGDFFHNRTFDCVRNDNDLFFRFKLPIGISNADVFNVDKEFLSKQAMNLCKVREIGTNGTIASIFIPETGTRSVFESEGNRDKSLCKIGMFSNSSSDWVVRTKTFCQITCHYCMKTIDSPTNEFVTVYDSVLSAASFSSFLFTVTVIGCLICIIRVFNMRLQNREAELNFLKRNDARCKQDPNLGTDGQYITLETTDNNKHSNNKNNQVAVN
jgi:hypothetical protein